MTTHSSILAWRIPLFLPGESHGQRGAWQSSVLGIARVGHDLAKLNYLLFAIYDVSERHTGSGEKSDGNHCPES